MQRVAICSRVNLVSTAIVQEIDWYFSFAVALGSVIIFVKKACFVNRHFGLFRCAYALFDIKFATVARNFL